MYDANKPPAGSNVNQGNLKALDVPYPMVVAGTPSSFSFDTATRFFRLTYSTHAPNGARLDGGLSIVHVPWEHYRVIVKGATVASSPGAGQLVLRSVAGVGTVVLTVVPI